MTMFTEVMVEVADCHTTLYHLGATPPQNPPLPLSDEASYASLYSRIVGPNPSNYADITGHAGVMLNKLEPVFRKNNYWHYFFGNKILAQYPLRAWKYLAPISAKINLWVDFALEAKFNIHVSPRPYVLLYPFGWSNCLSLRLRGDFDLQELADFNTSLFAEKSFAMAVAGSGQSTPVSVGDLFDKMSDGVSSDAFGGILANDFAPKEPIIVTTVMASYKGNLKLNGMDENDERALLRIVKPQGPPPSERLVHRLQPSEKEKYVIMNNYGRFTWMQDKLVPVDRNYEHLGCNHNNTFNSLVHARHLYQLLTQAVSLDSLPASLGSLAKKASDALDLPSFKDKGAYKSASLRGFLDDPAVIAIRGKMQKFFPEKSTRE